MGIDRVRTIVYKKNEQKDRVKRKVIMIKTSTNTRIREGKKKKKEVIINEWWQNRNVILQYKAYRRRGLVVINNGDTIHIHT